MNFQLSSSAYRREPLSWLMSLFSDQSLQSANLCRSTSWEEASDQEVRFFPPFLHFLLTCKYILVWVTQHPFFCRPRHYFSSSVWEQKKASEGGTKKRQAIFIVYFSLSFCQPFSPFFLYVGLDTILHVYHVTGTMIYINYCSCQMDCLMGPI